MESMLDGVFTTPNPNLPSQIDLPRLLAVGVALSSVC
jgi:hypothetical protein